MSSEADRIIGLYQRHARAWAADRGSALVEKAWLDRFMALMPARSDILDLGCGSGEPIARYFVENGHRVTGVESSPDLIAMCRERLPEQRWLLGDMRTLSLEQAFHGILAWDSFFHLSPEHQRRMFDTFAEHSAPRAALMFTSGPSSGVAMGTYGGEPLYHASLDAVEYRELLDAHGFDAYLFS